MVNPQSEAARKLLVSQPDSVFEGKQRVALNMASDADVAARYGVRKAPALVLVGPGGVPAKQLNGRVSKDELSTFLK